LLPREQLLAIHLPKALAQAEDLVLAPQPDLK
jgi:hypothetical protein